MKTLLLALLAWAGAAAQDAPARIDLGDLAWLEGCWEGEAFGSPAHECWMLAPGGRLTGMFQLIRDGQQAFSEIFIIDEFDGAHELRLKHFHPDLTGWEAQDEWVTFTLLETGPDFARFSGLEYRLDENGALLVDLAMRRGGERVVERLVFTRAAR